MDRHLNAVRLVSKGLCDPKLQRINGWLSKLDKVIAHLGVERFFTSDFRVDTVDDNASYHQSFKPELRYVNYFRCRHVFSLYNPPRGIAYQAICSKQRLRYPVGNGGDRPLEWWHCMTCKSPQLADSSHASTSALPSAQTDDLPWLPPVDSRSAEAVTRSRN